MRQSHFELSGNCQKDKGGLPHCALALGVVHAAGTAKRKKEVRKEQGISVDALFFFEFF
jgi:hypothetical protein